jgi:hypothetical protein
MVPCSDLREGGFKQFDYIGRAGFAVFSVLIRAVPCAIKENYKLLAALHITHIQSP